MKLLRTVTAASISVLVFTACQNEQTKLNLKDTIPDTPYVLVLGIAQDGGYPQAGCQKKECQLYWEGHESKKFISCLALVDPESNEQWLFDATPDIRDQLHLLQETSGIVNSTIVDGIFLTHAHIGHYTGLMQFGHEVLGATEIPVFAMPRMKNYLETSGPWSQLVKYRNIILKELAADTVIQLNQRLSVEPFLVPHREEYAETVGYKITGPSNTLIFIPDINKWEVWEKDVLELVRSNNYLLLDGTFYKNGEIEGRDMSEFPHPFMEESMQKFSTLDRIEKGKIHFIHLNHTNPAIISNSKESSELEDLGYHISRQNEIFGL